MERIPQEVIRLSLRGGGFGSWAAYLCKPLPLFFVVVSAAFSQTVDVLIVEKPQHLTVYDSFQQSLAQIRTAVFQPFTPLKILTLHDVLNDGITSCMKVEFEGDVFYLLYDEKRKLSGSENLGMTKTFRGKVFFGDTIEVLPSARLAFLRPDRKTQSSLMAGDQCVRYFEHAGAVYVKKLGPNPEYGWLPISPRREDKWRRVVHSKSLQSGVSAAVIARLTRRISEVNQILSEVYSVFGKETGKRLPVPRWYVNSTARSITCVLQPVSAGRAYEKSIAALTVTLQTYLLGTGLDAIAVQNRIEIQQR